MVVDRSTGAAPSPSSLPRQQGLTLVDWTVILGLGLTVALFIAPSLVVAVDASRRARALTDCNNIASAIARFHHDTGRFPLSVRAQHREGVTSEPALALLVGPASARSTTAPEADGWVALVDADPWNNRYAVNAAFLQVSSGENGANQKAVWVLSAGPNRVLETRFSQPARSAVLGGDDIGARIQ